MKELMGIKPLIYWFPEAKKKRKWGQGDSTLATDFTSNLKRMVLKGIELTICREKEDKTN